MLRSPPATDPLAHAGRPAAPERAPAAHRLYAHLAWTTLGSVPLVGTSRRAAVESHLLALCRWLGTDPVETCVLPDRVHLLLRFGPGQSLADLARRIQEGSEGLLAGTGHPVRWSRRFAAITVSPRDVRQVRRRIAARGERAADQAVDAPRDLA